MIKLFVFAVLLALVVADSILEEKPGYCLIGDIYIKEGEQAGGPIGKCMRMKCINAGPEGKRMSGVGCSTFVPRRGCTVSAYDKTKRYPACCPKEVCPEGFHENKLD